jgi:hypothetical protein
MLAVAGAGAPAGWWRHDNKGPPRMVVWPPCACLASCDTVVRAGVGGLGGG